MSAVDDAREALLGLLEPVTGHRVDVPQVDTFEAAIRSGTLDVERLALAMKQAEGVAWPNLWTVKPENLDWIARQVAAEYARLTEAEK